MARLFRRPVALLPRLVLRQQKSRCRLSVQDTARAIVEPRLFIDPYLGGRRGNRHRGGRRGPSVGWQQLLPSRKKDHEGRQKKQEYRKKRRTVTRFHNPSHSSHAAPRHSPKLSNVFGPREASLTLAARTVGSRPDSRGYGTSLGMLLTPPRLGRTRRRAWVERFAFVKRRCTAPWALPKLRSADSR